jgi:hypothetical protein
MAQIAATDPLVLIKHPGLIAYEAEGDPHNGALVYSDDIYEIEIVEPGPKGLIRMNLGSGGYKELKWSLSC